MRSHDFVTLLYSLSHMMTCTLERHIGMNESRYGINADKFLASLIVTHG